MLFCGIDSRQLFQTRLSTRPERGWGINGQGVGEASIGRTALHLPFRVSIMHCNNKEELTAKLIGFPKWQGEFDARIRNPFNVLHLYLEHFVKSEKAQK